MILKNKFLLPGCITILLTLTSCSGNIVACDYAPPTIRLACSNLEMGLFVDQLDIDQVGATLRNLHEAVPACQEDLTPALPRFEQEITQWISTWNRRRLFSDGDLTFEPYSRQRERDIQWTNSFLFYCYYEETQRAGDWLIVRLAARPYCVPVRLRMDQCVEPVVSMPRFLLYLFTHPSLTSLAYLAGLVLVGRALLHRFQRLTRDEPGRVIWTFAVLALVTVLLSLGPFWVLAQIPVWLASLFILFLLYKSLWKEQESRRQAH